MATSSILTFRDKIIKVLEHFGGNSQKTKAIEEMSELITALSREDYHNDEVTRLKIQSEIADVLIMVSQLKEIYGFEAVDNIIEYKLARTFERYNIL